MKTTKTLAKVITLSLITSTMIHATNGDHLIAVGAKARGMGGVGIAVAHGAGSGLSNGALITSVEGTEIGFGGILFMPDMSSELTGGIQGNPIRYENERFSSSADLNMIPEVAIANKINENWYIGVGMWGTAGMGVDYSQASSPIPGSPKNLNMITNLQLLQFGVPIAYKTGGLSLAVTPILQYGNLDIDYGYTPFPGVNFGAGTGLAQDFGFGYNLGVAYDLTEDGFEGLTIGAIYKSSIEMTFTDTITDAMAPFVQLGIFKDGDITDTLEQPAEFGVGVGYVMGQHTFGFDYKKIAWSETQGYGDFGWVDQDVYSVGYQFTQENWALRAGYNTGSSAVVELAGSQAAAALNFFNLLGFPATAEQHYTMGGSYGFTEQFTLDMALVYQPTNTETFSISELNPLLSDDSSISTDHSETSISFQIAYTF